MDRFDLSEQLYALEAHHADMGEVTIADLFAHDPQRFADFHVELDATSRAALIDAWSELPAHPDVAPGLAGLRKRGVRCVVLSNGTPRALERTVTAAGLRDSFDALHGEKQSGKADALAFRIHYLPDEIVE